MEIPASGNPTHPAGPVRQPLSHPGNGSCASVRDYDVVVIGGGPQGTAIAYDLATRQAAGEKGSTQKPNGLKILLLEKNDIGAGTSAYSSRLIHGGLRYLNQRWNGIKLVWESLQEREFLLKNAPHLVRPLQLALPVYPHSQYGRKMMRLGMMVYDKFSWGKSVPSYEMLDKQEMITRLRNTTGLKNPVINPDGLTAGALYYDGQVNLPERLCLEMALAAEESGRAEIRNHSEVTGISPVFEQVTNENQMAAQVYFRDVLTGENLTARAKVVINAAGPWVDTLIQRVGKTPTDNAALPALWKRLTGGQRSTPPDFKKRMGGTKGTHIVVRRPAGTPPAAIYSEARKDKRPFFILPWRDDYYLIGTTDIHYKGSLDHIAASDEEIDYLLEQTNYVLQLPNGKPLEREDILYHYAGVRPLPDADENEKAGDITRSHQVEDHGQPDGDFFFPGFISIVGGKLTTARSLAEEVIDKVLIGKYKLRLPDGQKIGASRTGSLPLPGAAAIATMPADAKGNRLNAYKQRELEKIPVMIREPASAIPQVDWHADFAAMAENRFGNESEKIITRLVSHLIDLYGSRYEKVLMLALRDPEGRWKPGELLNPLSPGARDIGAQAVYAVRHEMARTLEDVLLRRVCNGLDADLGLNSLDTVSRIMARELGWDDTTRHKQMDNYRQYIERTRLAHLPRKPETLSLQR